MKYNLKLAVPLFALALAATSAQGAVIGQLGVLDDSTGLTAGDQYRLLFITSTTTNATSSDIGTYNTFVTGVAAASTTYTNLGLVNWFIVGSTAAVDARDNTDTNPFVDGAGVPIYLTDGTSLFAANNSDLWNGANIFPDKDENGNTLAENRAFTGSLADGTEVNDATDQVALGGDTNLGNGATNVRTGNNQAAGAAGWMTNFNEDGNATNSVYAMSEILTVVPEPSTTALLGLGGLALIFRRRK